MGNEVHEDSNGARVDHVNVGEQERQRCEQEDNSGQAVQEVNHRI